MEEGCSDDCGLDLRLTSGGGSVCFLSSSSGDTHTYMLMTRLRKRDQIRRWQKYYKQGFVFFSETDDLRQYILN